MVQCAVESFTVVRLRYIAWFDWKCDMPPPKPVRILLVDDHAIPEQLQPCRQPVPGHPACLCPAARSGLPAAGCAGRPQHGVGAVVGLLPFASSYELYNFRANRAIRVCVAV